MQVTVVRAIPCLSPLNPPEPSGEVGRIMNAQWLGLSLRDTGLTAQLPSVEFQFYQ